MPFTKFTRHAWCGSYPTDEEITQLESLGVQTIVDLTETGEYISNPFTTSTRISHIHYPIRDKFIPTDWSTFTQLVLYIVNEIRNERPVMIHCRAGHGRSVLVACSVLSYHTRQHVEVSIASLGRLHNKYIATTAYWKSIPSSMNRTQKTFLYRFFSPIFFSRNSAVQLGFNICSVHPVLFHGYLFSTGELAFQATRDLTNPVFLERLFRMKAHYMNKFIGEEYSMTEEAENVWRAHRLDHMVDVCRLKFTQHQDLQPSLRETWLRPLIDCCKYSHPENLVGQALQVVREELLMSPRVVRTECTDDWRECP